MTSTHRDRWELFGLSVAGLYLELALIRLLASEVRVFAYFKNFPLLAAFIGLGLGCYVADRRPIRWWLSAVALLIVSLAGAFSEKLHLSNLFFPDPALYIFRGSILSPTILGQARSYPIIGSLQGSISDTGLLILIGLTSVGIMAFLFSAAAVVFYPIGQATGRLFGKMPALTAYSVNIAGALTGSLVFTAVSYLELGPAFWLIPSALAISYWAWSHHDRVGVVMGLASVATLLLIAGPIGAAGEQVIWSPYYRISLLPGTPETAGVPNGDKLGWTVRVNHDYFQRAVDLRPSAVAQAPMLASVAKTYNFPYELLGQRDRVLVVGAGSGNDVAAALRAGAKSVTAVEIDRAILRIGDLHPERPYADPRVHPVVDDARAYFRKASQRENPPTFDIAVFGLLDSQTALSSMSSVRLEFYVYTVESMREALALLDKEHGVIAVTFSVGWRDWVGERLYETIQEAAGMPPLALALDNYDGGITYIAGPGLAQIDRSRLASLGLQDVTSKYAGKGARSCRDDWPFLYLNPTHLPWVYMLALAMMIVFCSAFVRRAMRLASASEGVAKPPAADMHMFLMGAAFMLLETGAIARLSLVFGTTWVVNAAVVSAVLLMILVANALVEYHRAPPLWLSYALLGVSLVLLFLLPNNAFVGVAGSWLWSALVVALPVLFSGFVFAATFAETVSAPVALGFNMLGSILGGALEAVSLGAGIRALSLIALGLYVISAAIIVYRRRASKVVESRVPVNA